MSDSESKHSQTRVSGTSVVVAIFLFGIVMTALVGIYWEFYTRPFRDLQYAIAAEFPNSSPVVIGGEHKSHKHAYPKTLRIIVRIPDDEFNPADEDSPRAARALALARIAAEHHPLEEYEELEIRLVQRVPEAETLTWSTTHTVQEWSDMLAAEPHS